VFRASAETIVAAVSDAVWNTGRFQMDPERPFRRRTEHVTFQARLDTPTDGAERL